MLFEIELQDYDCYWSVCPRPPRRRLFESERIRG